MNTFNPIIEFVLNYIVGPIFLIFWGIWKIVTNFCIDVMKHLYGKILVPLTAVGVFVYLIEHFFK